jgi:hypothetical protein
MLPEIEALRSVTRNYARVVAELGLERGEQPVVLPNGEWFPDKYSGDRESVERLLCRMQGYAGLENTEIAVRFADEEAASGACAPGKSGSCGTGCGTPLPGGDGAGIERTGDGFVVQLPRSLAGHAIGLTSTLARLLGAIRLVEQGASKAEAAEAELAAVASGFGVLLLEGSYLYSKSCGGPSVGKLTALGCGELAWAFALFLLTEGHTPGAPKKELSTTQRACLDEAWALARSNKQLLERLKRDPEKVANDKFELGLARSWLAGVFGLGQSKPADPEAAALEALERGDDVEHIAALFERAPARKEPKRERPRDDVSDLVDEALRELRG